MHTSLFDIILLGCFLICPSCALWMLWEDGPACLMYCSIPRASQSAWLVVASQWILVKNEFMIQPVFVYPLPLAVPYSPWLCFLLPGKYCLFSQRCFSPSSLFLECSPFFSHPLFSWSFSFHLKYHIRSKPCLDLSIQERWFTHPLTELFSFPPDLSVFNNKCCSYLSDVLPSLTANSMYLFYFLNIVISKRLYILSVYWWMNEWWLLHENTPCPRSIL